MATIELLMKKNPYTFELWNMVRMRVLYHVSATPKWPNGAWGVDIATKQDRHQIYLGEDYKEAIDVFTK